MSRYDLARALWWLRSNWSEIAASLALVATIAAVTMLLSGCGTSRDSQTKTVERVETSTGPLIAEIPLVGQVVIHPVRHQMVRSETEVSTEQTRIDAPEVGQIMQAAANATPWGGIIGAITTAGAAAFAGKKAIEAGKTKRQFQEVVDGIERGAAEMPDEHWEKLRAALEAEQSHDTKQAVKARVG